MVEPRKDYKAQETEEFIDEDIINRELALEEENARIHAPYYRSHKQVGDPGKDNTEARHYYKAAIRVINSWGSRRKHGIVFVRENLKIFNALCGKAHVSGIDESWLKSTFNTPEDYATIKRKLSRKKEKGSAIISLRALK